MGRFGFVLRRPFELIPVLFGVSLISFLLVKSIPGDPVRILLGARATEEVIAAVRAQYGLDQPLWVQYLLFIENLLQGEFGRSIVFKVPVSDILWTRLGNTAILAACVFALIIPVSIVLGVLAGMREGSGTDRTISIISIITTSVPEFASAVLLSFVFVFLLGWLPGTSGMNQGFSVAEMVMPVLVLFLYDFGYVTRMMRASMAEVMQSHYIRTAILKGLPFRRVVMRHAVRNALIAPFTVIVLQINWLLSGVIVVETFFNYKGFGSLLLEASLNQDIYVIQACTLIAVFVAVSTQTIADVGYMFLNPRIRFT